MIAAFKSGLDFHSANAMNMWGYATVAEVPKHRRQQVKIGGHGSNYLMGAGSLARDMQTTFAIAKSFQNTYYATYENVPLWHSAIRARIQKGLPIVNAFGWPRVCHLAPNEEGTLRAMVAHGPQSTIPMVVNRAWLRGVKALDPSKCRIMMQTHDSLTASVKRDYVDTYCAIMRPLAELPIPVTDVMGPLKLATEKEYSIPCDFEVGPSYGDMERYLSEKEEKRVLAELDADADKEEPRSAAEIAEWCGVNKDAVAAVKAGRGRDWWMQSDIVVEEIDENG
jgi:hypothetical protein